jgi:tRNA dimethylallyltransferase
VTLADWQLAKSGGIAEEVTLHPLLLLPPREWVYRRCDARFAAMLEGRAIAEVEALLARDLEPDLPVMRAIGVREIAALIENRSTREHTLEAGAQATRNYAKRQFTWFRRQTDPQWRRIEGEVELENIDCPSIFAGIFQR